MNIFHAYSVFMLFMSTHSLRLVSYQIPSVIDFREEVELSCDFDTEDASLYSVRWFVNDTEFYRYGPTMRPVKAFHYVDGISVQMSKSNHRSVVLGPLYFTTSGEFRCEVSTAPPLYRTLAISKKLVVVALPKESPKIEGITPSQTWGDVLHLNCTSSPSYPPAEIIWSVAGKTVPQHWTMDYGMEDELRIQSTKSGLTLETDRLPFDETGEVTVTCTAMVPGVYRNGVSLRIAKVTRENNVI